MIDPQGELRDQQHLLDVLNTGRFADDEFYVVVAFGGPLSYVFEEAGEALAGLMRVGDVVLASVMSTLGAWRFFLPQMLAQTAIIGRAANDAIIQTGDLRHEGRDEGHTCQICRGREVAQLVEDAGGQIVAARASNWAPSATRRPWRPWRPTRRSGKPSSTMRSLPVVSRGSSTPAPTSSLRPRSRDDRRSPVGPGIGRTRGPRIRPRPSGLVVGLAGTAEGARARPWGSWRSLVVRVLT